MNLTNFVQTGGFPVKAERLQELQTAYSIFNELGNIAGNLTIISGCNISGNNVSNGYVFINGEMLPFRGAYIDEKVIIIQENSSKEFENGEMKAVHFERYATFGNGDTSWLWSDFKRPFATKEIPNDLLAQLGSIGNKAESTTVATLQNKVTALENAISQMRIPKIVVDADWRTVSFHTPGNYYDTITKNFVYVYPPFGYNMSHLAGFLPSIHQIKFAGDVNSDDSLWCKWATDNEKVIVTCGASEMREATKVNYIAVWIKY
jgi:hypothetical protein